jgi:hypothetical protein
MGLNLIMLKVGHLQEKMIDIAISNFEYPSSKSQKSIDQIGLLSQFISSSLCTSFKNLTINI